MKKILSLFLTLVLAVGIFSVVPASAETYTEIDCPKLVNCADLDNRVNNGTAKGIFVANMNEDTTSNVYRLTVSEDSYIFMEFGGVAKTWTTQSIKDIYGNISIYSDINLTKSIANQNFQKEKQTNHIFKKFNAGTYYVQLARQHAPISVSEADIYAYFGYFPVDTEFFSVDFVKSENNGKNIALKLNTLDMIKSVRGRLTNHASETDYSACDDIFLNKDGIVSIGLNQQNNGYAYCYFTFHVTDIYGNRFSKVCGILTDHTTTVSGIPKTVEYTGKPITLKDLNVITGYSHSNCATYDVKYENNTDVGTAKVTITGNGNFVGSVTKTFKIVHTKHKNITKTTKKPTYFAKGRKTTTCSLCGKISSSDIAKLKLKTPKSTLKGAKKQFKVKYTKVANATGFEVKYKLGKGKFKVVKVTTKKSMTKVIKKLKKGSYKVQLRAVIKSGSKKAYSNWSSLKTVKVK